MYGRIHSIALGSVGSAAAISSLVLNEIAYVVFGAAVLFALVSLRQFIPVRKPKGRHASQG